MNEFISNKEDVFIFLINFFLYGAHSLELSVVFLSEVKEGVCVPPKVVQFLE